MNYNHALSVPAGTTMAAGNFHSFVYGTDGELTVLMKDGTTASFRGTVGQQIHMNYSKIIGTGSGVTGIALS